jgi:alpha-glucosidase
MRFLLLILVALSTVAVAQDYSFLGDYKSHTVDGSILRVQTTNRDFALQTFVGGVVKVVVGEDRPVPLEMTLPAASILTVKESEKRLIITFLEGRVELTKAPLRMSVFRSDGTLVTRDDPAFGHGWNGNEVRCWKVLEPELSFYGLGEKSGDVNRFGRFFTNWNADTPAYRNDSDPLYCNIPFFSGVREGKAFGVFFPNTYRSTFNLGAGNKRLYSFGADDGGLSYYVFLGPDMKDVLNAYTRLTGRMALPPKWALGYQQCRWSYYPEYEIRDIAKEFRQRKIPIDVLYFDIHYMDAYKVFTWHPERFPDPVRLLSDLHDQGYKLVTIIDPGVKVEPEYETYEEGLMGDFFLRYLDGELFQGQVWPGWCHFPDFRQAGTRRWWGKKDAGLRAMGVDGFWNDMNEPALWGKEMPFVVDGIKALHNVYGLLMARATYEGLLADNPNLRPFVVTRAGWAGIGRYSAVWTGDNSASFDDLSLSIRTNIGLGLTGVSFVGCDVGGFIGSPSAELYSRWMQAATLSPFMRSHTVHDSPDQEPWSFGEETERRCREAISRRYSLMPYLYSELHASHRTGVPMYRPLWLEFPNDTECYKNDYQHQFLYGPNLLAAPVLREGQRFQKVYLPEGQWFEVETEQLHSGGRVVLVEAGLDSSPLFYREGAIIPTRPPEQYVGEKPLETLQLTLVPGSAGEYTMIADDGVSVNGVREELRFSYDGKSQLRVSLGSGPIGQGIKRLKIKVAGFDGPVRFQGKAAPKSDGWSVFVAEDGVFQW